MSHPSYAKGYRAEKRCQAWLVHLGPCVRSMMSRGADLVLTFLNRNWTISCKCGAVGRIRYRVIKEELEKYDWCMTIEDRDPYPMIHIYAPKFIELLGKAEAQDVAALESSPVVARICKHGWVFCPDCEPEMPEGAPV